MSVIPYIAFLLMPLMVCAQHDSTYQPGRIVDLRGQVLSATNGDTLVFSKVKLYASDILIGESVADFDGNFRIHFCSNKVKVDSVTLQVEELGCLNGHFTVAVETNLSLTIYLKEDPTFQPSEAAKQLYLDSIYRGKCGTEEFSRDYDADPMFRHCDGRIESFRRLIEMDERIGEWERL